MSDSSETVGSFSDAGSDVAASRHDSWRLWLGAAIGALLGLVLVAYVALQLAPDLFSTEIPCRPGTKGFDECLSAHRAETDARRGVTTATLAILAGGVSIFGAIYTARNFALTRRSAAQRHALDQAGQLAERFTHAIDQLGSPALDVRIGGIYALERIAQVSEHERPHVIEVLAAYAREHAPQRGATPATPTEQAQDADSSRRSEGGTRPDDGSTHEVPAARENPRIGMPRPDVFAAMSVIARENRPSDHPEVALDLTLVDLHGVRLVGGRLQNVDFSRANLDRAELRGADLQGANLGGATLTGANLAGADLRHARLIHADLTRADLEGAKLEGAKLGYAWLDGAFLEGARLDGAHLGGDDVVEEEGAGEIRRRPYLRRYADQSERELRDLPGVLGQHVLNKMGAFYMGVRYDDYTTWPNGFVPKDHGLMPRDEEQ